MESVSADNQELLFSHIEIFNVFENAPIDRLVLKSGAFLHLTIDTFRPVSLYTYQGHANVNAANTLKFGDFYAYNYHSCYNSGIDESSYPCAHVAIG